MEVYDCGSVGCGIVGVWDWGRVYLDVLLRFIILPLVLFITIFTTIDIYQVIQP